MCFDSYWAYAWSSLVVFYTGLTLFWCLDSFLAHICNKNQLGDHIESEQSKSSKKTIKEGGAKAW